MGKIKPYTEAEIELIKQMRKEKKTWREISEKTGRNETGLYSKFYQLKKEKSAVKRKYILRKNTPAKVEAVVAAVQAPSTRPMIALVGTPHEVTTTIRELFS